MNQPSPLAQQALDHARRGEVSQALSLATQALADAPDDFGLTLFVGLLHSKELQLEDAVRHFERARSLSPGDAVARLELARALIGLDQLDEAERALGNEPMPGLEPTRLAALLARRRGRHSESAALYEQIIAADARDFESWGNLGICRLATGDPRGAADALSRSLELRPDQPAFREKWVEAQVAAGGGEEALRSAIETARADPANAAARVTVARLETLLGRPEQAQPWLDEALAIEPANAAALVALAALHERQNRIDALADVIDRLEAIGERVPELPLLRAQLAYRLGDFQRALDLGRAIPPYFEPGARSQIVGQALDRLGDRAAAFEAFAEMNRATGLAEDVAAARANSFVERLGRQFRTLSASPVKDEPAAKAADSRDPAFVLSFPRSGTTILDTLLMGHPDMSVTEERPMLDSLARRVGDPERLFEITQAEVKELSALYFEVAKAYAPDLGRRLLIDKQPFATVEVPLIHRVFPGAKLVFAERHPCDVVLSCFVTRFEPNPAVLNFTTLEGTARLYDAVMSFWFECRAMLPLDVHEVRYERLVADPETELRKLLDFLGLRWSDSMLDSSATARKRGIVNTASYAQVAEPLYDRSVGRWQKYREQMKSVLSILAPWVERFGYEM